MLASLLVGAHAYAEGNAEIAPPQPQLDVLWWDDAGGDVSQCAVLHPGTARARLLLSLPAAAAERQAAEVCLSVSIRSDTAHNWWFVAPPPAESELRMECGPSHPSGIIAIAFDVDVTIGFTLITAALVQPRHSTTPLVAPSLDALVMVVRDDSAARPAWLPPAPQPTALSDQAARHLEESHRVVREDERPEKEEYSRRTAAGRATHTPLRSWASSSISSSGPPLEMLRSVLDSALYAALEQPSPATLWPLLETPTAQHARVHQFRLFSDEGAQLLADELAHAHATGNLDHQPTNNVSDTTSATSGSPLPGSGVRSSASEAAAAAPPSLLLDEIRLDGLARALTASVLTPLSRLLYPEWTLGGRLDSYHAFSIHRRSLAPDQESWFRPSSNSEPGSAAAAAVAAGNTSTTTGVRAGVHSDVCEVSLNVALRVSPDLRGSRVGFEPGFGQRAGAGAGTDDNVLWLEHRPGVAFINLCQHRHGVEPLVSGGRDTLVVRGFASRFRRAPAEGFYEQCVMDKPAQRPVVAEMESCME